MEMEMEEMMMKTTVRSVPDGSDKNIVLGPIEWVEDQLTGCGGSFQKQN